MIQWMLAIWSLIPLPFLNPAWTSGSSWFTYCWSLDWRILGITLLACEMMQLCCSLSILCHCLSLGLEWKLPLSSPVATAEFSKFAGILSAALSQHHLSGFESRNTNLVFLNTKQWHFSIVGLPQLLRFHTISRIKLETLHQDSEKDADSRV